MATVSTLPFREESGIWSEELEVEKVKMEGKRRAEKEAFKMPNLGLERWLSWYASIRN